MVVLLLLYRLRRSGFVEQGGVEVSKVVSRSHPPAVIQETPILPHTTLLWLLLLLLVRADEADEKGLLLLLMLPSTPPSLVPRW